MTAINPDEMKPELRKAFNAYLEAWGVDYVGLTNSELIWFMHGYYLDQLVSLLASQIPTGKIVVPPGRN